MKEETILAYLQAHPEFLLNHAEVLGIRPQEGKVQSFAQAQWQAQQQKTAKMAGQLVQMMQEADANFQTTARLMAFARRLLAATTLLQVCRAVSGSLSEDFALPHHRLLLLEEPKKKAVLPEDSLLAEGAAREALQALTAPVCGQRIARPLMALLPQQGRGLESFLLLPVAVGGRNIAVVVAGDADEGRFVAGMPVDLVLELAACTAAALARTGGWK